MRRRRWIGTHVAAALPPQPVMVVAPVISGTPTLGQTLTLTDPGTWNNAISFDYQWFRRSAGGTDSPIPGATATTYVVVSADVGGSLWCNVGASNSAWTTFGPSNVLGLVIAGPTPPDPVDHSGTFLAIGPSFPDLCVEIDFDNNPTTQTRLWTVVTPDVRSLTYTRAGRNQELQRTTAGTLQMVLDNRAGKYDFDNTSSPYYPGVKRARWIRVRHKWPSGGAVGVGQHDGWAGIIETWSQQWPESGKDGTCTVTAAGVFKILNLFDLAGLTFPAQSTSQRVAAVCSAAGVPVTVTTGASLLDSVTFSGGSVATNSPSAFALDHLLDVESHENGLVTETADGIVAFQDRHFRLQHQSTPIATIGDGAGEIPYRTAQLDLDDVDLANDVAVTTADGSYTARASNAQSKLAHFTRRLNRQQLNNDHFEADDAADYLAGKYATSAARIPAVELLPATATSLWPTVLEMRNSDRFTWKRRAMPNTITEDVYVEQVQVTIVPHTSWTPLLQLSPATQELGWVLDNAVLSVLDSTTVPVY